MTSSDSDSDSGWNKEFIAAVIKKPRKGKIISEQDRRKQMQECLDQGADINSVDENGNTALHMAVKRGYQILVQFLWQTGASVDISNCKGQTAIMLAENLGKQEIANILKKTIDLVVCRSTGASDLISVANNPIPSTSRDPDDVIHRLSMTNIEYNKSDTSGKTKLNKASEAEWQLYRTVSPDTNRTSLEEEAHVSEHEDKIDKIPAYEEEKTYSAAATLTRSWPGIAYQLKHLAFTLHCALQQKDPYFFLASEMIAAEKLDDVVLLYKNDSGNQVGRFVQIKYTSDRRKKIVATQLLAAHDDFSVSRYFISWRKVKVNELFREIEVRNIILCTNMGLDVRDLEKNNIHCQSAEEPDKFFELKSEVKSDTEKTAWYKFTADKISNKKLYYILKETCDRRRLAKVLAECVYRKKPVKLDKEIFRTYHLALVRYVFNTKPKEFYDVFIQNKNLSEEVKMFRKFFLYEFRKLAKSSELDSSEALTWTEIQNRFKMLDVQQNFGRETKSGTNLELPVDDYIDDVEISTFLQEFTLAVNQPNEDELNGLIRLKMDANSHFNLLNTELLDCAFQTKMWDWFVKKSEQKKGREYFSYKVGKKFIKDMNNTVGSLITIGMNSVYCEQIKACDVHFKSEMQQVKAFLTEDRSNSTSNQILEIVAPEKTLLTALRVYDMMERIPKYKKMDSFIFTHLDSLKLSWILNTVMTTFASLHYPDLLIVDCGANSTEQYLQTLWNPLCEIMAKNVDKRMIVITRNVQYLGTQFKLCRQIYHEKNDADSFSNLRNDSKKKLLKKLVSKFQGQKNVTSFGELLGVHDSENLRADELKDLLQIIDSDTLVKLIFSDQIQIGGELKGSEEIGEYYINRIIYRRVVMKQNILKDQEIPDLLAISGMDGKLLDESMQIEETALMTRNPIPNLFAVSRIGTNLPGKLVQVKETSSIAQIPTNITILNSRHEEKQFKTLCAKNEDRNIHWLEKESEKYVWKESQGDISNLLQYRDLRESDSNNQRTGATKLNESQLAALDEPVIISDTAGMGKSIMLTYLACQIKKNNPDMLVVRIDLNHHAFALAEVRTKSTYDLGCINGAVQFLVDKLLSDETNLARKVFKRIIEKRLKVTLIFDGFDEISPTYESTVIDLLQTLKNSGIKKLLVATRPHTREALESKFNAFSYEVEPFSTDNQEDFLTKFWTTKLGSHHNSERIKTYVNALMKKLASWIKDQTNKFIGNPLHTRLMAEIFESHIEEKQETFDSCKKFISSKVDEPNLPEKISLIYFYEHFMEKKFDNYFSKRGGNLEDVAVTEDKRQRYHTFISTHKKLALYALFDKDKVEKLLCSPRDMSCRLAKQINRDIVEERTGIITQFIDDKPHFGHQTYAEYFAANIFSDMLKERDQSQWLQEIFVKDVLLSKTKETMRAFLNCQLADKHIDVLDGESWKFHLTEHRGMVKETIFHIAAAEGNGHIISLFWNCLGTNTRDGHALINVKDGTGCRAVHRAVQGGNLDVIKLLVKHTDFEIHCQSFMGLTPLHLAVHKGEIEIVNYLLHNGANFNSRKIDGGTALHIAAHDEALDMVKILVDKGADVDSRQINGLTPLHLAAHKGALDMVKILVDKGADVDSRKQDAWTPAHPAAQEHNISSIKYFYAYKADEFNPTTKTGCTPLQLAAAKGKLDVVKYLLDKGAEINSKTSKGTTSLHQAAYNGQLDVVKYLIETGANIDSRDKDGSTSLHMVAYNGQLNIVKYLVEKGANIDSQMKNGSTSLLLAAQEGRSDVVKYLLDEGANINSRMNNNLTPLHLAAQDGRLDVVKYLLDKGADINSHTDDGSTTLLLAARKGKLDVVKYLLDKGAEISSKTSEGTTSLHQAAYNGQLDVVKYLVEKGANIDSQMENGSTSLLLAAQEGRSDVVKYLLDKGANINLRMNNNLTPLHLAAQDGRLDVVKYLLDKGADINSQANDGLTPLHLAACKGKLNVVKYLLDKGADSNSHTDNDSTPLLLAAREGELDIVRYLVDNGADIDAQNNGGFTPLNQAAYKGELSIVKYLLAKGANVNSQDNDGWTPLHEAAQEGKLNVVKYLLVKGADINFQAINGVTPLHQAARKGELNIVKYMLDKGANISSQDNHGSTSLHLAALEGKLDVVEYLLDNGAIISTQDADGYTPLHAASSYGELDVVKYLLNKGANINIRQNNGATALHQAAVNGKLDVVKYLLDKRADINSQDNAGFTPLHQAAVKGTLDTVKYLINKRANINLRGNDNSTALHLAAQEGKLDIVKYLLNKGAKVNSQMRNGLTSLHLAACKGELDVVKYLLDKGANINSRMNNNLTPLHLAAQAGKLDIVKYLRDKGAKTE